MRIRMNNCAKLSYILLCSILVGSNLSANLPITKEAAMGLCTLIAVVSLGKQADQLNEEYTKKNRKPNFKLAIRKIGSLWLTTVALECVCNRKDDSCAKAKNLAIKSILLLGTLPFATDTVANHLRPIPIIGGLLTDPVDKENGKECKHMGAYIRALLPYLVARQFAITKKWIAS